MRIGTQEGNFTAIATATDDAISICGRDLCTGLIGKVGFIMPHHADLAIEYDGPAPASAGERRGPAH